MPNPPNLRGRPRIAVLGLKKPIVTEKKEEPVALGKGVEHPVEAKPNQNHNQNQSTYIKSEASQKVRKFINFQI